MRDSLLLCLCEEEEVGQELDKTISDLPKILKGELLTIYGYPGSELDGMFEKVIYFSIFYCLWFVEDKSYNMTEKQVLEDTDPYLEGKGGLSISYYMEYNWM